MNTRCHGKQGEKGTAGLLFPLRALRALRGSNSALKSGVFAESFFVNGLKLSRSGLLGEKKWDLLTVC
jgi:hypothetical protein